MPLLFVTTRSGTRHEILADAGLSVMEAVRNAGVTDLVALCGGTLSCATCHVYVADKHAARLPPPSADETAMLDVSEDRRANSRLSCQLLISSEVEGLEITLAP